MSEANYILASTRESHEDAGETLKREGTLVTLRTALIKVRELKLMRKE